jgi:enamine deaminase RidA (YjgF/YER057c/UK114 family)
MGTDGIRHVVTDAASEAFMIRYRNPPTGWDSPRFSQVVEVQGARLIYLSGQAAIDREYRVVSGDFRVQLNQVWDNIEAALGAVGATLQNIVKTTTYIVDAKYRQDMREVRAQRFKHLQAPPANTALVVSRLIEPEFLVEIDVVAAVPLR